MDEETPTVGDRRRILAQSILGDLYVGTCEIPINLRVMTRSELQNNGTYRQLFSNIGFVYFVAWTYIDV